ncbi:MAG: hypothetical protein Ta2E_00720 [Mycoplasmoidaceae bacterium]|nr:MAG: hypothetical protein Ta2E_00720 [Mycoplasmoidaceae bacterium]
MIHLQIIEDFKMGMFHPDFDVLYSNESDRYIVKRLLISDEDHKHMLDKLSTGLLPEGYVITSDINAITVRLRLIKKKKR